MSQRRPKDIWYTRCKHFDPETGESRSSHRLDDARCNFAHPCDPEWAISDVNRAAERELARKRRGDDRDGESSSRKDSDAGWGGHRKGRSSDSFSDRYDRDRILRSSPTPSSYNPAPPPSAPTAPKSFYNSPRPAAPVRSSSSTSSALAAPSSSAWGAPSPPAASGSSKAAGAWGGSGAWGADSPKATASSSAWGAVSPSLKSTSAWGGGWGSPPATTGTSGWGAASPVTKASTSTSGWGAASPVPKGSTTTSAWGAASPVPVNNAGASGWGSFGGASPVLNPSTASTSATPGASGSGSGSGTTTSAPGWLTNATSAWGTTTESSTSASTSTVKESSSAWGAAPSAPATTSSSAWGASSASTPEKGKGKASVSGWGSPPASTSGGWGAPSPPPSAAAGSKAPGDSMDVDPTPQTTAVSVDRARVPLDPAAVARKAKLTERVKLLVAIIDAVKQKSDLEAAQSSSSTNSSIDPHSSSSSSSSDVVSTARLSEIKQRSETIDSLLTKLISSGDDEQDWPFSDTTRVIDASSGKAVRKVVVDAPEGMKGMIESTKREIEELKTRQDAIMARPIPEATTMREDASASGAMDVDPKTAGTAPASNPNPTPAPPPPTTTTTTGSKGGRGGKKRKASAQQQVQAQAQSQPAEPPTDIERIHAISSTLSSYSSQLASIESARTAWSSELTSSIDARLAALATQRAEVLEKRTKREDEAEEALTRLEGMVLSGRERVKSALKPEEEGDGKREEKEGRMRVELEGRLDSLETTHTNILHSLRALVLQHQALSSPSSTTSSTPTPNAPLPPLHPATVSSLRTRIASDTKSEYSTSISSVHAQNLAQTKESQEKIVERMRRELDPLKRLGETIVGYLGAEDREFVGAGVGEGNDDRRRGGEARGEMEIDELEGDSGTMVG